MGALRGPGGGSPGPRWGSSLGCPPTSGCFHTHWCRTLEALLYFSAFFWFEGSATGRASRFRDDRRSGAATATVVRVVEEAAAIMCDSRSLPAPPEHRGKESWAERGSENIYNFLGIHWRRTYACRRTLTHHIGLISP